MQQRQRTQFAFSAGKLNCRCAGLIELEALAASLLLGLMLIAISQGLSSSLKLHFLAKQELESRLLESKYDYFLGKLALDLDSHILPLAPVIHPPGEIRFSDGSLNSVMQSELNAPALNAQAVSGLALSSQQALYVTQLGVFVNNVSAKACGYYKNTVGPLANYKVFLGVSIDGFYELSGSAKSSGAKANCYDLTLKSGKSISIAQSSLSALWSIRALIPIKSNYTVYLSKNRQLRFLSHANETNLENQPLLDLEHDFGLNIKAYTWNKINFFELEILSNQKRVAQIFKNNLLARQDPLNFLLNRL